VCSKSGNVSKEVRAQPTKTCILIIQPSRPKYAQMINSDIGHVTIPDFQGVVSPDTGLQVVIITQLHHMSWLSFQS
jgi:hypothetical protein